MGQRKHIPFRPDNTLEFLEFDLNIPYDVYLNIVDGPDFDGLHHFFLREDIFDESGADMIARAYKELVNGFAQYPDQRVGEVGLHV